MVANAMQQREVSREFNLDWILGELGSFGKYQLFLLMLLAFRDGFLAMCNLHYVFTAAEVNFKCVSGCVGNLSNVCAVDSYNATCAGVASQSSRCPEVLYETNNSIIAEFNLACEQWKGTLIATTHNLGLIFSFVVSGFISDRYGRKIIIVGTPLVVGVCGLLKSFSVNIWMLLVLEFIETCFGYGNASLVLTLEIVSQNSRVVFSSISDILTNICHSFFGLIAWKIPYWRYTMRAIYAPLLVVVFYIFLVDEGVRWLLAHNKKVEAIQILNKVAKVNNVTLSKTAESMMQMLNEEVERAKLPEEPSERTAEESASSMAVLRSKKLLLRLLTIGACFFFSIFIYYGALINITKISGNIYLNYSLLILVSVPVRIISAYALTRFGRKAPICCANCLCAVFFVTSAFIPNSAPWWVPTVLYLLGKMCASFALFAFTVFAMEVFPTTSRNTLTNISTTFGRIGSVLAPMAPMLSTYMPGLPSVVFGTAAIVPAGLVLFLPDSSRKNLPDDVQDAEAMEDEREGKANSA